MLIAAFSFALFYLCFPHVGTSLHGSRRARRNRRLGRDNGAHRPHPAGRQSALASVGVRLRSKRGFGKRATVGVSNSLRNNPSTRTSTGAVLLNAQAGSVVWFVGGGFASGH